MLQLKNIVKNYTTGDTTVNALRGVDLAFRESEFVSILGQSGCGKTTLLNIIGGLDMYTSGDLIINGRSTKEYKNADWDIYRNHSVGFVFQSYNLIQHQTVLSNVELALTLSGVSKNERKKRAKEALQKVGLGDQLYKKPNQMSGGQMQRVAIARAIVNDPDILLADEPTGALDTATSIQIMDLLKEISKDRLIIMVTHNPTLAETYSTRIVSLLDGQVTDDTMPYTQNQIDADMQKKKNERKKGKKSMNFLTALSLSFNNLMTKRARTLLTSFAGSIGIIGIALILALSTGVQEYINSVQRDTMSSYPLTIQEEESSIASLLMGGTDMPEIEKTEHENDAVYSNPQMYAMFNAMFTQERSQNNLTKFKQYLDEQMNEETSTTDLYKYASNIQYRYDVALNCYTKNEAGEYISCDVSDAFNAANTSDSAMSNMISANLGSLNMWTELLPGKNGEMFADSVYEQYELVDGQWPTSANEIVLILDSNNEISDIAFYSLGLIPSDEVSDMVSAAMSQKEIEITNRKLDYDEVIGKTFKLVTNDEYYSDTDGDGVWSYIGDDDALMRLVLDNAYDLKISGIVRSNTEASPTSMPRAFGYTSELTEYIINSTNESDIVKAQTAEENENVDVLSGLPFVITEDLDPSNEHKAEEISAYFETLTDEEKVDLLTQILSEPSQEYIDATVAEFMTQYDTREKMEQLAADSYGMDIETARSYMSAYTDDELNDLMSEQIVTMVKAQYAAQAQMQIEEIMNTMSDEERQMMVGRITAELTDTQTKIGYLMTTWAADTAMSETAIATYLMGLTPEELDEAVNAAAEKTAAEMYASMSDMFAENRTAKGAAAFDAQIASETDVEKLAEYYDKYMPSIKSDSTLNDNLDLFGVLSVDTPSTINIYADSFENKNLISEIITEYNDSAAEEDKIEYTDYVALLMSGITDIINAISYGLIAFVAISLVVSSIMIGIITYISVLERTKEIGILRSIGASKHDVSLVFNAETIIVGLASGLIGIGISLLLCIPINLIIHSLTGIMEINAFLQPAHSVILVLISVVLTMIAGLIPSGLAAKKDPVEALRSE